MSLKKNSSLEYKKTFGLKNQNLCFKKLFFREPKREKKNIKLIF